MIYATYRAHLAWTYVCCSHGNENKRTNVKLCEILRHLT